MATVNLPQQFAEMSEARQQGFLKVKALKEEGRLVAGIFCTFTPLEILDAAGFTTVSLCGMSAETIPAAETVLPKNMCPLIKSSYGFALSDKCPYTYFSDLIVGETTCDGKKKMYELLSDLKPVYCLKLPQGDSPDALRQWTFELRRFIQYLEETFHVEITPEKLRQAIRERNLERQARLRLMEVQKNDPPLLWGKQLYKTLEGAGFLFETEERRKKLDDLRQGVLVDSRSSEQAVPASAKRILVTGCPIGGVLEKTVGVLEKQGGVVVCFENCSGIKAAYQMVDEDAEDPVKAIGERYLRIGCPVMTPNTERVHRLKELIQEYQVEGVIEIDLTACTVYTVEQCRIRDLMKEWNVPYMAIETDYSQGDSGQLETRLEAFIERLQ